MNNHTGKRAEPLIMVEMVFPESTNHYGTMFGGKVLDLMDRAAFLAATRFTKQSIVTASMERLDFYRPIKHGHLVELRAHVVYTGKTSLTVKVDLYAEIHCAATAKPRAAGIFTWSRSTKSESPFRFHPCSRKPRKNSPSGITPRNSGKIIFVRISDVRTGPKT